MSQFLLTVGDRPNIGDIPGVSLSNLTSAEELVQTAAIDLMSDIERRRAWVVGLAQGGAEELFALAQRDMASGKQFGETTAGMALSRFIGARNKVFLWYAADWHDLPQFRNPSQFLSNVETQLGHPPGEVYAIFDPG